MINPHEHLVDTLNIMYCLIFYHLAMKGGEQYVVFELGLVLLYSSIPSSNSVLSSVSVDLVVRCSRAGLCAWSFLFYIGPEILRLLRIIRSKASNLLVSSYFTGIGGGLAALFFLRFLFLAMFPLLLDIRKDTSAWEVP